MIGIQVQLTSHFILNMSFKWNIWKAYDNAWNWFQCIDREFTKTMIPNLWDSNPLVWIGF